MTGAPTGVYREREVKLAVAAGFQMPLFASLPGVVITPLDERRLVTVYWDTTDLRLIRWGCALRYRVGEGWMVKLPSSGGGRMMVRTELTFAGAALRPPPAALELLRAFTRGAQVSQAVRMRTVRSRLQIHEESGPLLAEIDDDEVSVSSGRRLAARFREVEVELTDIASDPFLTMVVDELRAAGAGAPTVTPKLVRALGDRAAAAPDVVAERVPRDAPASAVIRGALAASVIRLISHDPAVRLGNDPEAVHQARVAARRLRSDLATFLPLLDPAWVGALRDELRWLGGELGAVRDADVLSDRMGRAVAALPEMDRAAGRRIVGHLDDTSARGRGRLLEVLNEPRYTALLDRVVAAAAGPAMIQDGPAAQILPGLVGRSWRRLRQDARRIDVSSPDPELHALRIRAKGCRYAAEAVAPVIGRRARAFAKRVAALQEVLGDHRDAVVAAEWVRGCGGSGSNAFVAGELSGMEIAAAQRARAAVPGAWRRLDKPRVSAWCRRPAIVPIASPAIPQVVLTSVDGGLAP